jgi:hypothetical protein
MFDMKIPFSGLTLSAQVESLAEALAHEANLKEFLIHMMREEPAFLNKLAAKCPYVYGAFRSASDSGVIYKLNTAGLQIRTTYCAHDNDLTPGRVSKILDWLKDIGILSRKYEYVPEPQPQAVKPKPKAKPRAKKAIKPKPLKKE